MSRRRLPSGGLMPAPPVAPLLPPPPPLLAVRSGCTVTTAETALEAAWAALTFAAQHPVPVLIYCDPAAYDLLQRLDLPSSLLLRAADFAPPAQVKSHNRYHRADAIAAKMDALELAVAAFGDAVFFDADLTFFSPLPAPDDNELILSPNFEDYFTRGQHGLYNAGLVWTRSQEFCHWWRSEYLSGRSRFYEQSALDLAPSKWRCSYYGPEHNHGFWRGPLGSRRVGSVHCHLSTALDDTMSAWARTRTQALRAECRARIDSDPVLSCLTNPL